VSLPELLALDTNCFIYLFQHPEQPRGRFLLEHVVRPAACGDRQLVTSTLVLAELLVAPQRQGLPDRAQALSRAVTSLPGLVVAPVDVGIAAAAARLRGRSGVALPDAIVLATASQAGAVLLTNDQRLARTADVPGVLLLDELVAPG